MNININNIVNTVAIIILLYLSYTIISINYLSIYNKKLLFILVIVFFLHIIYLNNKKYEYFHQSIIKKKITNLWFKDKNSKNTLNKIMEKYPKYLDKEKKESILKVYNAHLDAGLSKIDSFNKILDSFIT